MAKKAEASQLPTVKKATPKVPVIGVFATSDPRIDEDSRTRCQNIVKMAADTISGSVILPDKTPVPVVYSPVLIDGEAQADIVAEQFRNAGVDVIVCVPDTWAFPQLTLISPAPAVPGRHAGQHHLRQQRAQARASSTPTPLNGAIGQYGQAGRAERRHLARHRAGTADDRRDGQEPDRLVLRRRDNRRL